MQFQEILQDKSGEKSLLAGMLQAHICFVSLPTQLVLRISVDPTSYHITTTVCTQSLLQ